MEVCEIISEIFKVNIDELNEGTRLIEDLGADSMDLLTATINIEKRFNIAVDTSAVKAFLTINDVSSYIKGVLENGDKSKKFAT